MIPASEIRCLTRGQKLTDQIIDHIATSVLKACGGIHDHYIPTYIWRLGDISWDGFADDDRVFLILNQNDHWFLLVRHEEMFHLYDSLPSIEESIIEIQDLPIGDSDPIQDYYGIIPHQGNSATNCGIHSLLNMIYVIRDMVPSYDPSIINKIVRPFLKTHVDDIDIDQLLSLIQS